MRWSMALLFLLSVLLAGRPVVAQQSTWGVTYDTTLPVTVGTRDYQNRGHLLALNTSTAPVTVTLTVHGFTATSPTVVNFFTGATVTTMTENRLTVTLPALGIQRGTAVYVLTGTAPRLVTLGRPAPTRLRLLPTR